jgi:hypothetical protein
MCVGALVGGSPSAVEDRVRLRVVAVLLRDNHTRIAPMLSGFRRPSAVLKSSSSPSTSELLAPFAVSLLLDC